MHATLGGASYAMRTTVRDGPPTSMTCPVASCSVVTGRYPRGGGTEGDTTIEPSSAPLRPNDSRQSSGPGALATQPLLRAGSYGDGTSTSLYAQHLDPIF